MTDREAEFITKSLKSLQKQLDNQTKAFDKLEKRVRELEFPSNSDEVVVRTADGRVAVYLVRNEEGDYVEPSDD